MSQQYAFGYIRIERADDTQGNSALQRHMAAVAEEKGYLLSQVFVETADRVSSAYADLVDAIHATGASAVFVPSLDHFGNLKSVGAAMKQHIEEETGARVMVTAPEDEVMVHDVSCAQRIRWIRLAEAGEPVSPPTVLLTAIAAEISSCCGQPPLRAHRLAYGWTVTTAVKALHGLGDPGISRRAWQDWETGKRPNRHNQDLLCRLFSTGPVELGFARDYRENASAGSTGLERAGYALWKGRAGEGGRPQ